MSSVMTQYLEKIVAHLQRIHDEEAESIRRAAEVIAEFVRQDKVVYIYGPGGHSNLAAQEIFFRAGGLMHVSAILDEGTLLSNGALRSMAIERMPGYGRIVIQDYGLTKGDLLIIVNAYGINAATIDAALEAKRRGVRTIGVTSVRHASSIPEDHPARHPTKLNLHEIVDIVVDTKVDVGDAVIEIDGLDERVAPISTFANAYCLNAMTAEAVRILVEQGITPPIWRSANAPGGDEANARFLELFRGRIRKL